MVLAMINGLIFSQPISGRVIMKYNVSAMISTGIKSNLFPIKHLAKTFYFVLLFSFLKPNQKIWRT